MRAFAGGSGQVRAADIILLKTFWSVYVYAVSGVLPHSDESDLLLAWQFCVPYYGRSTPSHRCSWSVSRNAHDVSAVVSVLVKDPEIAGEFAEPART